MDAPRRPHRAERRPRRSRPPRGARGDRPRLRDRFDVARPTTFAYPEQLPAPYTILVEDIPGPGEPHKHIDMIYFVRPVADATHATVDDPTLRWVTEAELRENAPLDVAGCGVSAAIPEDVRQLALAAIAAVRRHKGRG